MALPLRLELDAWSTVKGLRQATNYYAPPLPTAPLRTCLSLPPPPFPLPPSPNQQATNDHDQTLQAVTGAHERTVAALENNAREEANSLRAKLEALKDRSKVKIVGLSLAKCYCSKKISKPPTRRPSSTPTCKSFIVFSVRAICSTAFSFPALRHTHRLPKTLQLPLYALSRLLGRPQSPRIRVLGRRVGRLA